MERIIHELQQGTPEWEEFRLHHNGASEAAAMLGISTKTPRDELLRAKATGIPKTFSSFVQERVLDKGHEVEELARPIAEEIIGDALYRTTYSLGKQSASCDGITMDDRIVFEHKQWNGALAESVKAGVLPDEYQPQCQQIMHVTGAEKVLFMCSDGTRENCVWMWVDPDPSWVKRILAGWIQFDDDVATYTPAEVIQAAVAAPVEGFGALILQVEGRVVACNLDAFRAGADAFLARLPKPAELQTDQDFANAESAAKACTEAESRIKAAKEAGLAQMADVDAIFRAADQIIAEIKAARLALEKGVEARKTSIRTEIAQKGKDALAEHMAALNQRIGRVLMPPMNPDFVGAIKGKRTVESLRNAVNTLVAQSKITANEIADRIQINLRTLEELAGDRQTLFPDLAAIAAKPADDFAALVKMRVFEAVEAEKKRAEAERQKQEQRAAPLTVSEVITTVAPAPIAEGFAQTTIAAPAAARTNVVSMTRTKIDGLLDTLTGTELDLVLHYCERVIAQRQGEAA